MIGYNLTISLKNFLKRSWNPFVRAITRARSSTNVYPGRRGFIDELDARFPIWSNKESTNQTQPDGKETTTVYVNGHAMAYINDHVFVCREAGLRPTGGAGRSGGAGHTTFTNWRYDSGLVMAIATYEVGRSKPRNK